MGVSRYADAGASDPVSGLSRPFRPQGRPRRRWELVFGGRNYRKRKIFLDIGMPLWYDRQRCENSHMRV